MSEEGGEESEPGFFKPIEWTERERQELQLGQQIGMAFAVVVASVYVRTMHPTVTRPYSAVTDSLPY